VRLADVSFDGREGAVVARVSGEIDLSNAEEIGTALVDSSPRNARAMVLDLSGVEYLDSAGIQLIYRLRENLRARGVGFRLVIPTSSPSSDALRLAGISSHIPTLQTIADALGDLD
jgi:anti-anti-sigma factor